MEKEKSDHLVVVIILVASGNTHADRSRYLVPLRVLHVPMRVGSTRTTRTVPPLNKVRLTYEARAVTKKVRSGLRALRVGIRLSLYL